MIKPIAPIALALLLSSGTAWADEGDTDSDAQDSSDESRESDSKSSEAADAEAASEPILRRLGNAGDIVLSGERLSGFARTQRHVSVPNSPDLNESVNRTNLLLNGNGDAIGYSAPRLALDYFVADGWSLGGSLGYTSGGHNKSSRYSQLTAHARLGYAWMFASWVGVWPRAGLTFIQAKRGGPNLTGAQLSSTALLSAGGATASLLAASADVALVLMPAKRTIITLGPTLDLSFFGKFNPDGPTGSLNMTAREVGIALGVAITF
jgi:hypothetical protein